MSEISKLIQSLYKGKPNNNLLSITGNLLAKQTSDSYKIINPNFTTADAVMMTRLTRDVWQFSAAKNYQQLNDLTQALKDENNNLRSFSDFKLKASSICDKYQNSWLKTEYNLAIASSQNAARWIDFTKDADKIPFLQ